MATARRRPAKARTTNHVKKNTTGVLADVSAKRALATAKREMPLPLPGAIRETRPEADAASAQAGLKIMTRLMDQEIAALFRPWGSERAYRHESHLGYAVYAGREVGSPGPAYGPRTGTRSRCDGSAVSGEWPDAEGAVF